MKKYVFLVLGFLIFSKGFSQNEVLEIPVQYKSTSYSNKDALAISNKKTGELVLFIEDNIKTKAVLLNSDLEIISEIETTSLISSFKTFIGYQINANGVYSILFTNKSNKKYGVLNLNFSSKTSFMKTLDFKLKKEVYVESVSYNNTFYLISVTRGGNDVHFYGFENGSFHKKTSLNFDFLQKKSLNNTVKKAYNFLVSKGANSGSLIKMDNSIPNGIETTTGPNKLYIKDDNFVFTFDNKIDVTQVLTVSPQTFEMNLTEVNMPDFQTTSELFTNHNSYLFDNKIFQIIASSSLLKFVVKDYESKAVLKEFQLTKEDSITFKNSPIVQEGGSFGTREMEKTSKFLRKVSKGDIGISVYKQDGLYKITLGSEVVVSSGGGGMAMGGFGGMPMGGGFGLTFNPTFYTYGGYSSTKTTYIDCLFNSDFNHVKGDVPDNVFDRIKTYEDALVKDVEPSKTSPASKGYQRFKSSGTIKSKLTNVFQHNDMLYFSYLDTEDRNYHIIEFQKKQ